MTIALLLNELRDTAVSVLLALLPLAALFVAFQAFILKLPPRDFRNILAGTALSGAGLFLFLLGVSLAFLPVGRAIGEALGALPDKRILITAGLLLGLVTTWGEPAVRILASQVEEASNGSIRRSVVLHAVCIGVGLVVALGMLRIAYAIPILYLVGPGYLTVIAIMWLCDKDFVGIAVDSGGVATGPLANTFLLALAFGASAAVGGQNPIADGLGLVALIAVAPVISLMVLGFLIRRKARRKE
ncbi:MAG TPA: DUF1538 domain-containing protein [Hyphomicrobiaceae bacterium]|nr:DUF1538 domain-containing protein [Hyphomicrobiaceae bacterium]